MGKDDLTIKVNYVLGDTSAFKQGAHQASVATQQANAAASGLTTGTRAYNVQVGKPADSSPSTVKGVLENIIGTGWMKKLGIAGAVGAAAYGSIGTGASDMASVSAGGPFLRGHGFAGMIDSAYGFLSGRSTREALQDMKLQHGDFKVSQFSQKLETQREIDAVKRQATFKPITEINQLQRTQLEREKLSNELRMVRNQATAADEKVQAGRILDGMQVNQGRLGKMKVGGGIDEINFVKEQIKLQDDLIARSKDMIALRQQQVQLETEAVMQRKQTIKDDATAYGAMSPEERMFANSAAQRLRSGQQLTPEEISSLSGFGSARPDLDKYLRKQADESGFTGFLATAGDEGLRKAADRAEKTNVTVEAALDEEKLGAAIWKNAQGDLGEFIKKITVGSEAKLDLERRLQRLKTERSVVAGTSVD